MKKEQQLREAIRSILKEKKILKEEKDLLYLTEFTLKTISKLPINDLENIRQLVMSDSNIINVKIKHQGTTRTKGDFEGYLGEDIDPDFLDKVETRKEEEIIEILTDISLQLTDVQKYILKFRPKLVDELAKAKAILEEIQNKLSSESMIGENKLDKVIKEVLKLT